MENSISIVSNPINEGPQNILNWKVGDLVSKDLRTIEIFIQNKIDYCCGGKTTVLEACVIRNLDPIKIQHQLQEIIQVPYADNPDFNPMALKELADYIVQKHHRFVQKSLRTLFEQSNKVVKVHEGQHPELIEIQKQLNALSINLAQHINKEEKILFPYIKSLEVAHGSQLTPGTLAFRRLNQIINVIEAEHDDAADHLNVIKKLSQNYTPPNGACTSYQAFYEMLKEFEEDLHKHVHLENNILYPKARKLATIP